MRPWGGYNIHLSVAIRCVTIISCLKCDLAHLVDELVPGLWAARALFAGLPHRLVAGRRTPVFLVTQSGHILIYVLIT